MQIKITSALLSVLFLGLASACAGDAPPPYNGGPFDASIVIGEVTAAQILAIAPQSACNNANFPDECSTSEIAAGRLNEAFATYGLTTLGQKAAMIAYGAFESSGFAFNRNHYPGRPGQGTKTMFMFPQVYKFALSIPELKPQVITLSPGGVEATVTFDNYENIFSPDAQQKIRELVLPDQYTFRSAPWFLTAECAASVQGLNNGVQGWTDFMGTGCIYAPVPVEKDRTDLWCLAIKTLAPKGMQLPC